MRGVSDIVRADIRRIVLAACCLATLLSGRSAHAQRYRHGELLSAEAVSESLAVLQQMNSAVRAHPEDSASWHRLGIVAWVLSERANGIDTRAKLDGTQLGHMADSSLRIAIDISPRDVRYRLDLAQFLLSANVAITRTAARFEFEKALNVARKSANGDEHAETALEYGRTHWWIYEMLENRSQRMGTDPPARSVSDAMQPLGKGAGALEYLQQLQQIDDQMLALGITNLNLSGGDAARLAAATGLQGATFDQLFDNMSSDQTARTSGLPQTTFKDARTYIEANSRPLPFDVAGASDYEYAYQLFQEAYAANPSHPGAFRALAMVYAARGLWRNLESHANTQLRLNPHDASAWMALGLANHRLQQDVAAGAAFDSALRLADDKERRRLDSWARVLSPNAAAALTGGTERERAAREQLYWMLASPIWSSGANQTRAEFLSRVAFAEIRWTVEELELNGADTDRGDIYIRYGPPDRQIAMGPDVTINAADITTFWLYNNGLIFAFSGMPTFATARLAQADEGIVSKLRDIMPVRWDNVAIPVVDSLPVQVTRFRAQGDSIDVVVAARMVAADSIKQTMSVRGEPKRSLWLVAPGLARETTQSAPVDTAGTYSWLARISPATFVYRVEEFGETATRAARATGMLDATTPAFPPAGFSVSDILLATSATAPSRPMRWSELHSAPLAGTLAHGADLVIVWETYDLYQNAGQVQYDVSVTLKPVRTGVGRVVARAIGAIANSVRSQSADDGVTFQFQRTAPYAAAFADQLSVSLADTPAGTYSVTLIVTDKATGKAASSTKTLVIR